MNLKKYTWTYVLGILLGCCADISVVLAGPACTTNNNTQRNCLTLLEPFDSSVTQITVDPTDPFSALKQYLGTVLGIVYTTAIGICIFWILIGGIQIMTSGDNSGQRQEAMGRIRAAIIGVALLVFGGTVLRFLNDIFFVSSP